MPRPLDTLVRLLLVVALGVTVLTAVGLAVAPIGADLATAARGSSNDLALRHLSQRSSVYAADGSLLAVLREEENREAVPIDQIPQHVIDAVLAVEDADFRNHAGVNVRATIRAFLSNVETGAIAQGGSTITQQLVKQSLLTSEQDFDRKSREAFLAVRLERQMSKDEILERYLNTIYLGNHSYGIQAAAETYFGVDATQLDVGQAALLAGLIRDPIDYNPFLYPEVAKERRRIALRRMVEEGALSEQEAAYHQEASLPDEPIEYVPPPDDYFVEEVKQALLYDVRMGETATERFDAVFRGGLEIHTTLMPDLQAQAEVSRDKVLSRFSLPGQPALFIAGQNEAGQDAIGTVATATVEPDTGAVRAMIGGPGFGDEYKFNLATQGYRQPGSAFKTFVLLELMEQGYSPADTVSGIGPCRFKVPGVVEVYKAENFGNSGGSFGSITSLTTSSSNCGYLRLGQIAGIRNVVSLAGELGMKTRNAQNEIVELDPSIFSTPLGTQEVTPLDMAAAYATIANDGVYNPPYFVERVVDHAGTVLLEHRPAGIRVVSTDTAEIVADILERNVRGGTGTQARVSGHDIGGKTGTAQDFSNGWFVGFSRQYSTAVWMGAIEGNVSMRRVGGRSVTGGAYPAQIFGEFMRLALADLDPEPFADPPSRKATGTLRVDRAVDLSYSRPRSTTTTAPADSDGGSASTSPPPDGGDSPPPSAPPTSKDFVEP